MELLKQTHKRKWIGLGNFCKAFYLVQHDSHCLKYHREFPVSVNTQFTVAKDYSLHPSSVSTQCCQAVSKGQMGVLEQCRGSSEEGLPLVMCHTRENVTKIPGSSHVQDCFLNVKNFYMLSKDA